jgi:alanine racemase
VHPAAAPRVRISRAAIVANIRAVTGGEDGIVDLRRDARGHGFGSVAEAILTATGLDVLADPADIARSGTACPRVRTEGSATMAASAVFGLEEDTAPAMTLIGTVLAVKDLRAGEGVSYGYLHRAAADTRVALVTGGYAQGIPRVLGSRTQVVISGRRHPVIGRVAMDVCVVDIADAPVDRGAEVVYFGDPAGHAPSVRDWARESGLRPLEIVTAVGLHTRREYSS